MGNLRMREVACTVGMPAIGTTIFLTTPRVSLRSTCLAPYFLWLAFLVVFFFSRGATRLYREGGVVGGPDTIQSLALGGAALEALPQKAAALTKTVPHAVIVSVWGIAG